MKKYQMKKIGGPGHGGFYKDPKGQTCNDFGTNYFDPLAAQHQILNYANGKKSLRKVDFNQYKSRDDTMYNQNQFHKNIVLDNSKPEREKEHQYKKEVRRASLLSQRHN